VVVEHRQPERLKLVDEFVPSLVQVHTQVGGAPLQGFGDHRLTVARSRRA
jgi:hypothetical protein